MQLRSPENAQERRRHVSQNGFFLRLGENKFGRVPSARPNLFVAEGAAPPPHLPRWKGFALWAQWLWRNSHKKCISLIALVLPVRPFFRYLKVLPRRTGRLLEKNWLLSQSPAEGRKIDQKRGERGGNLVKKRAVSTKIYSTENDFLKEKTEK